MNPIDDYVVRDGKWVSASETEAIPGEICVRESNGLGHYAYEVARMPEHNTCIVLKDKDGDDDHARCVDFDYQLMLRGLPKFFGEEEEYEAQK